MLFREDQDRDDFARRLATLAEAQAVTRSAWALLPNHFHRLVRTGARPLARSLRSLLTGYARALNRRRKRTGHLFQDRYKSIVVEEAPYLLELVRYSGLLRSLGGWRALRRGRERYLADLRVRESRAFVESLRQEAERKEQTRVHVHSRGPDLSPLIRRVTAAVGIPPTAVAGSGRSGSAPRASRRLRQPRGQPGPNASRHVGSPRETKEEIRLERPLFPSYRGARWLLEGGDSRSSAARTT